MNACSHATRRRHVKLGGSHWGIWRSGGLFGGLSRPRLSWELPGPGHSRSVGAGRPYRWRAFSSTRKAGVKQILEKDVLDVLRADAARAQRGEAGLHQEDQCTCAARAERASAPRAFPLVRERRRENGDDSRTGPHEVEGVELCLERGDIISQRGHFSSQRGESFSGH